MITFDIGDTRFNFRAAAVCLHDGQVLLHRAEVDDFWAMPGGRAEPLESTPDTLRRELLEEIGVEVTVGRLLWVVENFFVYRGRRFHELAFYYEVNLPEECAYLDKAVTHDGSEPDVHLIYQWFPVSELSTARLFPTFLRTALQTPPSCTEHIVHTDPPI